MQKIRAAAVSMENWIGQQDRSIARMAEWTGKAAEQGAEFIVFPELCVNGYLHSTHALRYAESIPGPSTARLVDLARRHRVTLCFGMLENVSDVVYNTQVVVNAEGILGLQRKIHMPGNEYFFWRGGFDIRVIDIGKARVGIAICYDASFFEMARTLFFKGAEILVMPFAYNTPGERAGLPSSNVGVMLYRAQCYANGCFGILANNAGQREKTEIEETQMTFPGWAGLFDPFGEVLDWTREPGNGEAMAVADLDPERLFERRRDVYFMPRCLRPEVYVGIIQSTRSGTAQGVTPEPE